MLIKFIARQIFRDLQGQNYRRECRVRITKLLSPLFVYFKGTQFVSIPITIGDSHEIKTIRGILGRASTETHNPSMSIKSVIFEMFALSDSHDTPRFFPLHFTARNLFPKRTISTNRSPNAFLIHIPFLPQRYKNMLSQSINYDSMYL